MIYAKFSSDIIEQGYSLQQVMGEIIRTDIGQITCTIDGHKSNVENDY